MRWAKAQQTPVFIVGHVTKEGTVAGPRVLEHMVDAVLYLEGDRHHHYRILRGAKNRFGSTNEVGVFEMEESGLREVSNPSEAFLEERLPDTAGSVVAITLEGTRPILVEVQALTSPAGYGQPRRMATGIDSNRLYLLTAVLSKRVGLPLGQQDIYLNVVGGLRMSEPAIDLAAAVAIASSLQELPIEARTAVVGEVGLSGELRSVSQLERRLREAHSLGFTRAIVPATARQVPTIPGLEMRKLGSVGEAIQTLLVPAPGRARAARRAEPERPPPRAGDGPAAGRARPRRATGRLRPPRRASGRGIGGGVGRSPVGAGLAPARRRRQGGRGVASTPASQRRSTSALAGFGCRRNADWMPAVRPA